MKHEPSLRWPILTEPADFDTLADLNEHERQIGAKLVEGFTLGTYDFQELPDHAALKNREPMFNTYYDPEGMLAYAQLYELIGTDLTGLTNAEIAVATTYKAGLVTDDPERQRKWELSMLFVYKIASERKDEWTLRLMATQPKLYGPEKCLMLGFPESNVWDDEERFVLEFTEAVMRSTMSDALLEQATKAWGHKGVVRRASWIGVYNMAMIVAHINLTDAYKRGEVR